MTADGGTAVTVAGPLGILAGGGRLPVEIAKHVTETGRAIHIVAIRGEASETVESFPHTWVDWGGIGRMISSFRSAGARELVIVGSVTRPNLAKVRPDFGLIRAIPTILRLIGGGDDHVLRNVVRFFEAQGFVVRSAADVAPALLVGAGVLGRVAPSPNHMLDAARGLDLITALGPADVGQAVVIRDRRALAIEAAEGTDRMLERLSGNRHVRAAGGILVKGPKPAQEMRVDMPVIGPRTIVRAAEAGIVGIAVAAAGVLAAERAELIAAADAHGLFIVGMAASPGAVVAADRVGTALPLHISPLTRTPPKLAVQRDMVRALATFEATAQFAATSAVVVVRRHVIAIETGEGLDAMFARVQTLRQWGATARSRRRGAVALKPSVLDAANLDASLRAAAGAGLAGAILARGMPADLVDRAAHVAGGLGLVVVEAKGRRPEPRS